MALVKCPECGSNVSTETENCQHCGAPMLGSEASWFSRWFWLVVVAGVLVSMFTYCKFTGCPKCMNIIDKILSW